MPNIPRISVVTVALNRENHISYAVESILAQTFSNWEYILVDNGSFDSTPEIMRKYAAGDGRIRVFSRPGLNLPEVRNAALAECRGDYVAILDSDDIALSERFERQLAFLDGDNGVDGIGTGFDFIDTNGDAIQVNKYAKRLTDPDELRRMERDGWSCFLHSSMLFRRSALEHVGGYRRQFVSAEDDDLYLRLLDHHNLANLPERLVRYRWHDGNACTPTLIVQLRRVIALASAHLRLHDFFDPVDTRQKPLDYAFLLAMLEQLGTFALPVWLFWIGLLQFYHVGEAEMVISAWRKVLSLPLSFDGNSEVLRHWNNFRRDFPQESERIAEQYTIRF